MSRLSSFRCNDAESVPRDNPVTLLTGLNTVRVPFVRRVLASAPPRVLGIGAYVLARLVGFGVLALMAVANDEPVLDQLVAWDGQWYLGIAEHGYTGYGENTVDAEGNPYSAAPFAFFPALPAAMSIVTTLGAPLPVAGVIVGAWLSAYALTVRPVVSCHRRATRRPGRRLPGVRPMIEHDRVLLARAGQVNRQFGEIVVELMIRQDGGQLPAGPLRDVGELLAGLGREFIDRAAEIDAHPVIEAESYSAAHS